MPRDHPDPRRDRWIPASTTRIPIGRHRHIQASGGGASCHTRRSAPVPTPLSPREREVVAAAVDGSSIATIATRHFLSEGTVRNYLSSAIEKTGARNRIEAVRVAERLGWS